MKLGSDLRPVSCLILVAISIIACSPASACGQAAEKAKPPAETGRRQPAFIKPLTQAQQDQLLEKRLDGGMQYSFRQFANVFLAMSRIQFPCGVGLMTSSQEIADTGLQPVFPKSYRPTLREFLDVIALQTSSRWKYDPTSKYFHSEVESGPVEGPAIFEFTRAAREKPFHVTLAKGWKSIDKGH